MKEVRKGDVRKKHFYLIFHRVIDKKLRVEKEIKVKNNRAEEMQQIKRIVSDYFIFKNKNKMLFA